MSLSGPTPKATATASSAPQTARPKHAVDSSPNSVVDRVASVPFHTKSEPKTGGGVAKDLPTPIFENPVNPRIVVVGATGAGKSTTLNRLSTPVLVKRAALFKEGGGAASETEKPEELTCGFFGREHDECNFVDMPGLNDSNGAQADTRHIREAARFLISRPDPFAHLFVLVVNSASPRLSGSIRNMMTTFKQVFDAGSSKHRFIDYLAIVFTKVEFRDFMYEDGDSDGDLVKPDEFHRLFRERFDTLARDWAVQLAALLGHEGDVAAIDSLRDRCVFTDHKMPKRRVEKLRDMFHFDVETNLGRLYLWALYNIHDPFPLGKINTEVQAKETQLLEQAELAETEAALAKHRELEAAEAAAVREKQLKADAEAERERLEQEAVERERRLREEADAQRKAAAAREEQLRIEAERKRKELEARAEQKRKEMEAQAEKKQRELEAKAAAEKQKYELELQKARQAAATRSYSSYSSGG